MPSFLRQLQDVKASMAPSSSSSSTASGKKKKKKKAVEGDGVMSASGQELIYKDPESLPSLACAQFAFRKLYSKYSDTCAIDEARSAEYAHLDNGGVDGVEGGRVCLDYCGFGLFSHDQVRSDPPSASFALSAVDPPAVNLRAHAAFGAAPEGTSEHDLRTRIMDYLSISEPEYAMVFTVSRGAAFKLLADAYPFGGSSGGTTRRCRLIAMYDYESESVGWMRKRAKEKGAKLIATHFDWPSLRVCSAELKRQLTSGTNRNTLNSNKKKGLFVFPVQSRVSGAKYSYQWMSLAQQNGWHVLLDASALAPKDMDSLGLSLFKPDFIVASFYKVFGDDPSGFGCLFIKNSAMKAIQDPSGAPTPGIVKIVPLLPSPSVSPSASDAGIDGSFEDGDGFNFQGGGGGRGGEETSRHLSPFVSSFSGPMLGFNAPITPDRSRDLQSIADTLQEGDEEAISCSSPAFSEDGSGRLFCIGPSSVSEEILSGPLFPRSSSGDGDLNSDEKCQRQVSEDVDSPPDVDLSSPELDNTSKLNLVMPKTGNSPAAPSYALPGNNGIGNNALILTCPPNNEISREDDNASIHSRPPSQRERAIRRETEGNFRLLGGRMGNIDGFSLGRRISLGSNDYIDFGSSRASGENIQDYYYTEGSAAATFRCSESGSDRDGDGGEEEEVGEPEIICRSLDHADMLGLNKSSYRLRCLVSWLITSLLQLRHPGPEKDRSLVHIYGPHLQFDRGASIAFNLFDCHGNMVHPELVLTLADRNNISVSVGYLQNLRISESHLDVQFFDNSGTGGGKSNGRMGENGKPLSRIEVVTVALGLLTNFEDVYRTWTFVAGFLDADFVSREVGRHRLQTVALSA